MFESPYKEEVGGLDVCDCTIDAAGTKVPDKEKVLWMGMLMCERCLEKVRQNIKSTIRGEVSG